jgi:PAS domain S-box-containing protein
MKEVPVTVDQLDPRLAALARLGTVFAWSATADAQIEFVNDAWLAFRGRTAEQESGEGWIEDVHPDDIEELRKVIATAYERQEPFEHQYRIRNHEGRYRWLLDRGEPWFHDSGVFGGFHGTALDIDGRVRAEQTANLLSEVGRLVASGEDPAAALEAVARATIPVLGDTCVLDLVDENGGFVRPVLVHRDPETERLARTIAPPQPQSPLHGVLADGRAIVLRTTPEEFAAVGAPEDREARLRLALRCSILAPLIARGRALGVVTFGAHDPEFFDEALDLPLAEALARRIALALDHGASLREAREAHRASDEARSALAAAYARTRLKADVSEILEASLELDRVLVQVANLLSGRLADAVAIDVIDAHGIRTRMGQAATTPSLLTALDGASDAHDVVELPLARSGRELGALRLIWLGEPPTGLEAALVQDITRRVTLAIDAGLLYAERSTAARTLQASLLPERLPDIAGIDAAARYVPAAGGEVSGDFYDVFSLPDDSWMVVVGDVCGKGVEAAALTAQARYTIRALAPGLLAPARVLEGLNREMRRQRDDDRFVTVVVARLWPAADDEPGVHRLDVACAGHPCPFVLREDGTVDVVACSGPVAGILDDIELKEETVTLHPGDVFAAFTDGITEASRTHLLDSADLGAAVASERAGGPEAVALALVRLARDWADGPLRDDVAILALAPRVLEAATL